MTSPKPSEIPARATANRTTAGWSNASMGRSLAQLVDLVLDPADDVLDLRESRVRHLRILVGGVALLSLRVVVAEYAVDPCGDVLEVVVVQWHVVVSCLSSSDAGDLDVVDV